ncbi:hypothetical protein AZ54_04525 [Xanthomonas oryzae pv. oryzae PXO86]|nr:hypothetical protein AZ54_04525 [Xanthomonas oryzae pv. oryzae PXO86]
MVCFKKSDGRPLAGRDRGERDHRHWLVDGAAVTAR